MQVYQTDIEGFYIWTSVADPDPLTPGKWIIPGGCVTEQPPEVNESQRAKWSGSAWIIVDKEPDIIIEPSIEEIIISVEAQRQLAFQQEADPLFFKWRAGEGTEEAWLAKRQEIRDRYPYPEETI
jgi:hypothetical protein